MNSGPNEFVHAGSLVEAMNPGKKSEILANDLVAAAAYSYGDPTALTKTLTKTMHAAKQLAQVGFGATAGITTTTKVPGGILNSKAGYGKSQASHPYNEKADWTNYFASSGAPPA